MSWLSYGIKTQTSMKQTSDLRQFSLLALTKHVTLKQGSLHDWKEQVGELSSSLLMSQSKIITGQAVCRSGYSQPDHLGAVWDSIHSYSSVQMLPEQVLTSYFLVHFFIYACILLDTKQFPSDAGVSPASVIRLGIFACGDSSWRCFDKFPTC